MLMVSYTLSFNNCAEMIYTFYNLQGLGFEREAVIQALRSADNNVDAAANRLLR